MAGTDVFWADVSMGLTHVSENKEPFQPLPEPFPDLLPLSNVTKRNNWSNAHFLTFLCKIYDNKY